MKTKNILLVIASVLFVGTKVNAQMGNQCNITPPLNPLTSDWQIPLGGYNFNLTEGANTASSLFLGFPACNPPLPARFGVHNDVHQVAGAFVSTVTNTPTAVGVYSSIVNSGTNVEAIGVHSDVEVSGGGTTDAIGFNARVLNATNPATNHTGVRVNVANATNQSVGVNVKILNSSSLDNFGYRSNITTSAPSSANYGYYGSAKSNGISNYGAYLTVATASNLNYGIFAESPISAGSPTNYAGYFNGDVHATGTITSLSDKQLKENITPFKGAKEIINNLNPVAFEYKRTGVYEQMNLPTERQYGLIAQEVENVLPTFVKKGTHPAKHDTLGNEISPNIDFKAVNYIGLIPILVQANKEQITIIDSLEQQVNNLNDRLSKLENCLSGLLPALCQMNHNAIQQNSEETQELIRNQITVYLANKNSIVLDQNIPNPFAEQTIINFSIPETVQKAQIQFFDGMGKLLQVVDIRERGLGSITVFGANLSSGVYSYSLVTDEVIVATKRMIKE